MEPISPAPKQSTETTIHTAGGAYISGNVIANTFIGRDQYNYYFIGLAPLVHDPTRRFRNFLNEYLGTPTQPVPFGGRQEQLVELHRWLNDTDAPPYYLMTAEAGRGKSALVCRWMEEVRQQRPEVEVIFIPISIRFETAAQDTVFAVLAARLAKFYDEPLKPAALSGAQWQGVCESYLDRTLPADKQLLIILDGLDESAGWHFGAGFFSTDPPPGLRVVVTARLRVGESNSQGWAATLGWQERLTRMATLPPLTRAGVEEALASMGDPLDKLANKQTVIEQLYYLSEEGDPLLVKLYVDALVEKGMQAAFLSVKELNQLKPGLDAYFKHWWEGQKTQWKAEKRNPLRTKQSVLQLLNLLAAAQGPLTKADLGELAPKQFTDGILLDEWLTDIGRWVIGDGVEQGYTFSHPMFGYYFWAKMLPKQRQELDRHFCAWGTTTLRSLNAERLDPKAAPVYLLRHYGEHLERSHAPAEAFYALISNGWQLAWEWLDVSYGGFLGDVERVWEKAKQDYTTNPSRRAKALVQQVKAALCRSSVAVLGSNTPPKLLAQLVSSGLMTPVQALAFLKLVSDERIRKKMLVALIPHLPSVQLRDALQTAHSLTDEELRIGALLTLTRTPDLPVELLADILAAAHTIKNEYIRTCMLLEIASYLPEQLVVQALHIARGIKTDWHRATALNKFAQYLPDSEKRTVRIAAQSNPIKYDYYRAVVPRDSTPYISAQLLTQKVAMARMIKDEDSLTAVLIALVPHLSQSKRVKAMSEALIVTYAIENEYDRGITLQNLMPYLPEHERIKALAEALRIVYTIKDTYWRAAGLHDLLPHLTTELWQAVLTLIQAIEDEDDCINELGRLVPHLPSELLRKVFKIIDRFKGKDQHAAILSLVIPHLPDDLLAEVLCTIRAIESEEHRAYTLTILAPRLTVELQEEALATAYALKNEEYRAPALCLLAKHLPNNLLGEVLSAVQSLENKHWRSHALHNIALYMPAYVQVKVMAEALVAAHEIEDKRDRVHVLGLLAQHLPAHKRAKVLNEALIVTDAIEDKYTRVCTLVDLAQHLPSHECTKALSEALATARVIERESLRVSALCELVPHLPANLLGEALATACEIDEYYRARVLNALVVPYLPAELIGKVLAAANDLNEDSYVTVLRKFVLKMHTELLEEVLAAVRTLTAEGARVNLLRDLIPRLPTNLLSEAVVAVRELKYIEARAEVLDMLVPKLPECEQRELLTEALSAIHTNENTWQNAGILRGLAPHLATWAAQQPQQSHSVFAETLSILASQPRPEFLSDLAALMPFILALAGDEAPQAAEGIYHAIQEVCEWWP